METTLGVFGAVIGVGLILVWVGMLALPVIAGLVGAFVTANQIRLGVMAMARSSGRKNLRVVAIDDDPTLIAVVRHAVKNLRNVKLLTFTDVATALSSPEMVGADLIILDQMMPNLKGDAFARTLDCALSGLTKRVTKVAVLSDAAESPAFRVWQFRRLQYLGFWRKGGSVPENATMIRNIVNQLAVA